MTFYRLRRGMHGLGIVTPLTPSDCANQTAQLAGRWGGAANLAQMCASLVNLNALLGTDLPSGTTQIPSASPSMTVQQFCAETPTPTECYANPTNVIVGPIGQAIPISTTTQGTVQAVTATSPSPLPWIIGGAAVLLLVVVAK